MIEQDENYNLIVLFSAKEIGTVVSDDDKDEPLAVGLHKYDWNMDLFTDFNGSITISND
jgi:hypothetical protein